MNKLKKAFDENPMLVITLTVGVATAAAGLMTGGAKIIEATAYAYRASKM